jgi:DNA-binding LacI/PurR family transcriptional regulator
MIAISDIAKLCGVSKVTASRALNDETCELVAFETRKKILAMARKHNYRPNRVASNFSKGKTYMVGLIGYSLSDHFLGGIFTGVHDRLFPLGYDFQILVWSSEVRDKDRLIRSIVDRRLDGVIIAQGDETSDYRYLTQLQEYGIPIVAVDREVPISNVSFVGSDDIGGAKQATEYLIRNGHKDILFVGREHHGRIVLSTVRNRREGYRETMIANSLVPREMYLPLYKTHAENVEFFKNELQVRPLPTAVFALSDSVAADYMSAAKHLGLRVPEDISIVGFSDEPISSQLYPPLTTVKQEPARIGKVAADVLVERIEQKSSQDLLFEDPEATKILLPTALIVRNSVNEIC